MAADSDDPRPADRRADGERQVRRRAEARPEVRRDDRQRRRDAGLRRPQRADRPPERRRAAAARRIGCLAKSTARRISRSAAGSSAPRDILAGAGDAPLIFVGGTGLYFRALTEGLSDIPRVPEAVRDRVRVGSRRRGDAGAARAPRRRDPLTAARLRPSDRQRVLRALEVVAATGRPLVAFQGAREAPALPAGAWAGLFLAPDRDGAQRAHRSAFRRNAAPAARSTKSRRSRRGNSTRRCR